jgi:hypothetical protein
MKFSKVPPGLALSDKAAFYLKFLLIYINAILQGHFLPKIPPDTQLTVKKNRPKNA